MSQDEIQLLKQRLDSAEMRAAAAEGMRQEAEWQLHSVRKSIEARARETEDAQRARNQALGDLEAMRAAIHEAERRAEQVAEVQAERDWLQQQLVQQKQSSQSRSNVEDGALSADAKPQEESMSTRSTGTASSRALGTEGTLTSDAQEVMSPRGTRPKTFRGEPLPRQPQQSQRQNRPEHLEAAVQELALQVAACQEDIRASQFAQQGQQQRSQASDPGGPSGTFRASSSPARPSRSVERLMSGSWSQSVPSPAPSCKLLAKPDPPSEESTWPPEHEDASVGCSVEAGSAADGTAIEQREEPEVATELRRTVWQLQQRIANEQQKTAGLEDALHATLVRSANMEADNTELREFVGNLVGRIANLESQLQGQVRSPRSARGAMTPTAPGTASTPLLNLAASARGAGLPQQPKRRGRQGPERIRAGSPRTPMVGGASQLYR